MLECLERNEKAGVIYHYEGGHIGDYDQFDNEEELIAFILHGSHSND